MRVVIQRVSSASVSVEGKLVSRIARGYCVLVGVFATDTQADTDYITRKLLALRLFPDPAAAGKKPWDKSVTDIQGQLLVVSQFTLCHVLKGNKPDYHNAMAPAPAKDMFDSFVAQLKKLYKRPDDGNTSSSSSSTHGTSDITSGGSSDSFNETIQAGVFGAMMDVQIANDGPVTITLDSVADRGGGGGGSGASPTAANNEKSKAEGSKAAKGKGGKQQEKTSEKENSSAGKPTTTVAEPITSSSDDKKEAAEAKSSGAPADEAAASALESSVAGDAGEADKKKGA